MALIRWFNRPEYARPHSEVERLQREVNDLFTGFFGAAPGQMLRSAVFPSVNVSEDDQNLYVSAELPGIKSEDMEILVEGETLTLRGERKTEKSSENVNYHRRECETGRFRRIITFPTRVDSEGVKASFKNGVLKVVLPKAEEAKPKQIPVKIE